MNFSPLNLNKKIIIAAGLLCLIGFYFFSHRVKSGFMKTTDFAATVKIQEKIDNSTHLRAASLVDNTMEGATYLASPGVTVFFIIVITLIAVVDPKNKKIRLRGLLIPLFFGLLTLGELYGKSVVNHPSPPFEFIKHPTSFFPADYINEQFSYPSGHAARAVFIAICVNSLFIIHNSLFNRKTIRLICLIGLIGYVVLVSISRIYLGHHWLSDVIGGLLLGSGMALSSSWF